MNRILFVILAISLILSILANGCTGYTLYLATIYDIDIWADESSPPSYLVDVVVVENPGCDSFGSYKVTRTGNTTVRLEILNKRYTNAPRAECLKNVEHTFPIGSDFVPGGNYTIEINDVTVNFVAGVIVIYPAPILDTEIWTDGSLPRQYFVDVLSEEPSMCDHFDSYKVMRAGNMTITVIIFNSRCCTGCPDRDEYYHYNPWNTIPLGSDFVTGANYTVEVNDVTETFVA